MIERVIVPVLFVSCFLLYFLRYASVIPGFQTPSQKPIYDKQYLRQLTERTSVTQLFSFILDADGLLSSDSSIPSTTQDPSKPSGRPIQDIIGGFIEGPGVQQAITIPLQQISGSESPRPPEVAFASLFGATLAPPSSSSLPLASSSPTIMPSLSPGPSSSAFVSPFASVPVSPSMSVSVSPSPSTSMSHSPSPSTSSKSKENSSKFPSSPSGSDLQLQTPSPTPTKQLQSIIQSSSPTAISSLVPSPSLTSSASPSDPFSSSASATISPSPSSSSSPSSSPSPSPSPSPTSSPSPSSPCLSGCRCSSPGTLHGEPSFTETELQAFFSGSPSVWLAVYWGSSASGPFYNTWDKDLVTESSSVLTLVAEKRQDTLYGAAIRTHEHWYGYGCVSACMRPSAVSGIISSLFTYTGPYDGVGGIEALHNEIDIEFEGNNPRKVQFNYYTNRTVGQSQSNEHDHELSFDASTSFNVFGFRWTPWGIQWEVNGVVVHEVTESTLGIKPPIATAELTQKIMANIWIVRPSAQQFFGGPFDEAAFSRTEANYRWIRYQKLDEHGCCSIADTC